MRQSFVILAVILGFVSIEFGRTTANAALITVPITLDGASERPTPVVTQGIGTGTISYDTDTMFLSADIMFSDLTGNSTAAHFHGPASVDDFAGVMFGLSPTTEETEGTITGGGTLTAEQEGWLTSDLLYVNLHSSFQSGGEIRGQVLGVPEPSSILLGLLGLGSFALYAARRRRPPSA